MLRRRALPPPPQVSDDIDDDGDSFAFLRAELTSSEDEDEYEEEEYVQQEEIDDYDENTVVTNLIADQQERDRAEQESYPVDVDDDEPSFASTSSSSSSSSSSTSRNHHGDLPPIFPTLQNNYEEAFASHVSRQQQFSIGLMKFVELDPKTPSALDDLPKDTVGYFHKICVTVTANECTEGRTFGSMCFDKISGRTKLMELMFFIRAFCSPNIGTINSMRTLNDIPVASYQYCVERTGESYKKVYTVVEPLFKKVDDGTGHYLPLEQLYNSLNIGGYRVWFLISDPKIVPIQAIFDQIERQKTQSGTTDEMLFVTRGIIAEIVRERATANVIRSPGYSNMSAEELQNAIDAEIEVFIGQNLNKINTRVSKAVEKREKAHEAFSKRKAAATSVSATASSAIHQFLALEIDSPLKLFNTFICYENECLIPGCINTLCETCQSKEDINEYLNELPAEVAVNTDLLSYRPLVENSRAGVNLLNLSNRKVDSPSHVYALIDPEVHYSISSPSTLLRLQQPGIEVCEDQLNPAFYLVSGSSEGDQYKYFNTPYPDCVFLFSPNVLTHKEFFNMDKPWAINHLHFIMDMLNTEVDKRKREQEEQHSRRIADTIQTHSSVHKRAVEFSKRWRSVQPTPISPLLASRPFVEQGKTNTYHIPSSKKNMSESSTTIRVMHDFDHLRISHHEIITKFQSLAPYLCFSDKREFIRLVRAEGMRAFKSAFTSTGNETPIVQYCATELNRLAEQGESAFFELSKIAKNMSSTFANQILWVFSHAENLGVLHLHQLFVHMRLAVERSLHCHHTDKLYGQTTLIQNYNLFGFAGIGKSFILELVVLCTAAIAFMVISTSSACAAHSAESKDGRAIIYDEYTQYNDPTKLRRSPDAVAATSTEKERVTSHEVSRVILGMGSRDSSGLASVLERKSFIIVTPHHACRFITGNDALDLGKDTSYASRERLILLPSNMQRLGTPNLAEQTVRFGSSSIYSVLASTNASFTALLNREYILHCAISKLIQGGGLPYPCLDLLALLWKKVLAALSPDWPFIEAVMLRAIQRIVADALTHTINHAIYLVWCTIWSSVCAKNEDGTFTRLPYSHDQLALVGPLLFANEDICIYSITSGVFMEMLIPERWNILHKLAAHFGKIYSEKPRYVVERDENHNTAENPNLINLGKVGELVAYMENNMNFNHWMAASFFTYMTKVSINVDWKNPFHPLADTTKNTIPVINLIKDPNKIVTDEHLAHLEKTVHLAVDFIEKGNPNRVLKTIMDAICHKHIRPRTVIIGTTIEMLPFLPQTYDLKPGKHTIRPQQAHVAREYMDDVMLGHNVITPDAIARRRATREFNSLTMDMLNEEDSEFKDIESQLAIAFIRRDTDPGPGIPPRTYVPKIIEEDTEALLKLFHAQGKVDYPSGPMGEYTAKEDVKIRSTPLHNPSDMDIQAIPTKGKRPSFHSDEVRKALSEFEHFPQEPRNKTSRSD